MYDGTQVPGFWQLISAIGKRAWEFLREADAGKVSQTCLEGLPPLLDCPLEATAIAPLLAAVRCCK